MRRLAAAALLLLTVWGCGPRRAIRGLAVDASLPAVDQLVQNVARRRAAIQSIRTLARLAYTSPEEKRHAKQVILAARPDRLRFEVLSPFGTVFVLATSNGRLAAYARDEATVYRGLASATNLERYTSVQLPIAAAVDLLLGTPPLGNDRHPVVTRDGDLIRMLCGAGPGVAHVVWFSAEQDPVRFEHWTADGTVVLRAAFDEYTDVNGVRLPLQLTLETPATQRRVDIELRDPEINPALDAMLFALDTPRGSRDVDLDPGTN